MESLELQAYYSFLEGYSSYNKTIINPLDLENTTFTRPFGAFAYLRMPYGLYKALTIFQMCMFSIFFYMIENSIEVFMDNLFFVFDKTFDICFYYLNVIFKRCVETNLV